MRLGKKCRICDKRDCNVCGKQVNAHHLLFQEYMPHAKKTSRAVSEWVIMNRFQKTLHWLQFIKHYRPAHPKKNGSSIRYASARDNERALAETL